MEKRIVHRISRTPCPKWICLFSLLFICFLVRSQDLEPRAYIRVPVNANVILPGYSHSQGSVLTDPSLPLKDFKASVNTFTVAYARTFSAFGKTAQAFVVLPICIAQANATVFGQYQAVDRKGMADLRLRLSVLLLGGKAMELAELRKQPRSGTILGASLTVQPPTGQYYPEKLVNLGTGRWAFKPEIALSQPLGNKWLLDFYCAVWLFTDNDSYFTGNALRSQKAIATVQSHISYNISPFAWAAINTTYYVGGNSTVNGVPNDDQVSNFRIGATLVLPVSKRSGIKLAVSKGAIVVRGSNFTTAALGWTFTWL